MVLKGQSSVELTLVVGIALVLSSPFIFASQSSVIELRDSSRFLDLDQSLQEVRGTALELNGSSYPARRTVEFRTPGGVEKVYNPSLGEGGSALIFEVRARGESVNRSILMDLDFELSDPSDLSSEGVHSLSVRKADGQINASVVS